MQIKSIRKILLVSFICFSLLSCNKSVNDLSKPQLNPNILGPVAFTNIDFDSFEAFTDLNYNYILDPESIGLTVDTSLIIDPINLSENINIQNIPIHENFHSALVDSASITFQFTNVFPVSISAGTEIIITDSASNNILLASELQYEVLSQEDFILSEVISDTEIGSAISISIKNFSSPGSYGNYVNITSTPVEIMISIDLTSMNEVSLKKGFDLDYDGEAIIDLDLGDFNKDAITGLFNLFIENDFQLNSVIEIDILDDNNEILYTFFQSQDDALLVGAAISDGNGNTTAPYISDKIVLIDKSVDDDDDFNAILDGSRLRYSINLSTPDERPDEYFTFLDSEVLKIHMIADLIYDTSK